MHLLKKPLFLGTIFLIFYFSTLSYFFFSSSSLIKNSKESQLQLELAASSIFIEQNFHEIETRLYSISYFLQTYPSDEELLTLLKKHDQEYASIDSIYLGRPDKTMINSTDFVPDSSFDLTTRPWYQLAINSDKIEFTPTFVNATKNRVIVTAALAVYDDNESYMGVLAADIDIRTITSFVSEKTIGKTGYSFLVDINENLIAYPELDPLNIELNPISNYEPNLSDLHTYDEVLYNFEIRDVKGVLATKYIVNGHYLLGMFLPMLEYSQGLDTLRWAFFALILILILVAFIIYTIYQKRVNQPLVNLLNDISGIETKATLEYRLPEPKSDDYLSVRQELNKLLEKGDFYFGESQKTYHNLVLENQRVFLLMQSSADIIFEIDLNLRFVSVFGSGLKTLKMEPEDFIGKTVIEIFGEDGKEREQAYLKAIQGIHSVYDWSIVKNGQKLYFEASISPMFDEKKNIIGAVGITRDITEYMQKQKEIEYLSLHDFLTGLYNRRHFVEAMVKMDKAKYYPVGMIMLDLNGLKIFNDAYGHYVGDQALKKVAMVLLTYESNNRIVFRIGGDEFAMIISNTTIEDLEQLKDDIKEKLSNIFIENISLSVAIGYEIKKDAATSFEEVLKNAENQMYRNKITEGKSIRNSAIQAILKTLTDKFEEEKTHSNRVSQICKQIGAELNLRTDDIKELEMAGLFHDIGKISIPDEILHKPGRLTKDEFDIIKQHTENGYHILRAADEYSKLAEYALTHHEHWDGGGYPRGLKNTEIPLFSRIIGIADAFEAMTSDRVYRKKMSDEEAVKEIIKYSGTQFDPDLAKIFVEKVLKMSFNKM
ncbi:MAG: HD domain-containing phosphohydrolase [Bacilli bacterium]